MQNTKSIGIIGQIKAGECNKKIAGEFGVSQSYVSQLRRYADDASFISVRKSLKRRQLLVTFGGPETIAQFRAEADKRHLDLHNMVREIIAIVAADNLFAAILD